MDYGNVNMINVHKQIISAVVLQDAAQSRYKGTLPTMYNLTHTHTYTPTHPHTHTHTHTDTNSVKSARSTKQSVRQL